MLISLAWIREMVPVAADAADVSRVLTARGLTVDAIVPAGDDTVLDIDVPANRPDALGHRGVAREIAAAYGLALAPLPSLPGDANAPSDRSPRVSIDDPDLCGRFTASTVTGVRVAPSPSWVVARLEACGLRSINNVVDASNLVMLELGQPVHFYDLARLAGGELRARRARHGERLTTLDGVDRALEPGMLVIADARGPVGIAGVMGGAGSEVGEATADVAIEAASFSAASVRATARDLGMTTDASQRFARGVDPEAPPAAQARAVRLLEDLAGGRRAGAPVDLYPGRTPPRALAVRLARAEALLGFRPSDEEATTALSAVGLEPRAAGARLTVTVPSWRVDLEREADLIEEIGRHVGYERVPSPAPATAPGITIQPAPAYEEAARDRLAGLGFHEALCYAMIAAGEDDPFVPAGAPAAVALTNPISETLARLRRSIAPGLLRAAEQNLRRGSEDVRLFDVGRVFFGLAPGEAPDEPCHAGFVWSGAAEPRHWSAPPRIADAFDAAGIVEEVLAVCGASGLTRTRDDRPGLHPGRAIAWREASGRPVAWCGAIHPDVAAAREVPRELLLGEIDLAAAAACGGGPTRPAPVPRRPSASRDLSIVLAPQAAAGEVMTLLAGVPAPAPARFTWLDRYAGPPLGAGEVAMTLRVILQPSDRTLTDAEIEDYRGRLIEALAGSKGARLRRIDT